MKKFIIFVDHRDDPPCWSYFLDHGGLFRVHYLPSGPGQGFEVLPEHGDDWAIQHMKDELQRQLDHAILDATQDPEAPYTIRSVPELTDKLRKHPLVEPSLECMTFPIEVWEFRRRSRPIP